MAKILIIDDDPRVLSAVSRILEADGHEVTTAPNGRDALRWFAGSPTDLVITDVYMPEMDGIEFVMKLRETYPETPVIAMSGGSALSKELVLAATKALGAAVTMEKPLTQDLILSAVAEALGTGPQE